MNTSSKSLFSSSSSSIIADDDSNATSDGHDSITRQSSKALAWRRIMVFAVLVGAATVTSTFVYRITRNSETDDFTSEFEGKATKIVSEFDGLVGQKIQALGSLGATITSFVLGREETRFPFVAMNNFQEQAESIRELSDALYVEFIPIVEEGDLGAWEGFVKNSTDGLLRDTLEYQELRGYSSYEPFLERIAVPPTITGGEESKNGGDLETNSNRNVLYPVWESSPVGGIEAARQNLNNFHSPSKSVTISSAEGKVVFGRVNRAPAGGMESDNTLTRFMSFLLSVREGVPSEYSGEPIGSVYYPIFDSFAEDRKPVGLVLALFTWSTYFSESLPKTTPAITAVLDSPCQGVFTYEIRGPQAVFIGEGDLHDTRFTGSVSSTLISDLRNHETAFHVPLHKDECDFAIKVFPTDALRDKFTTRTPLILMLAVLVVFLFTGLTFYFYHIKVESRNKEVLRDATETKAIVSNLFPKGYREGVVSSGKAERKNFNESLASLATQKQSNKDSRLLADLYPEATVLFADVVGFTAWSSVREPSQVFVLLESLYQGFDEIARKRKVFKVETIGDCYVAVTGLPNYRRDHAVAMCRFARDIIYKAANLTKQLEVTLGPDTGDLAIRVGVHSGPVTAGVLRSDRARFQLFGDTVNTTARIEASSKANAIHISEETAVELRKFGKSDWMSPREEAVEAKGKGILSTYWLSLRASTESCSDSSQGETLESIETGQSVKQSDDAKGDTRGEKLIAKRQGSNALDGKSSRLVQWNVDVWSKLLKQIAAKRPHGGVQKKLQVRMAEKAVLSKREDPDSTVIDEVKEIISLPHYDDCSPELDLEGFELPNSVSQQLNDYIRTVAALYKENPFHNFEHASHVTMSVVKLMSRIVVPTTESAQDSRMLHDHTYGITGDPLTQFAVVFAGLVHDIDHAGVPNRQLVKEGVSIAHLYKNQSVAEQNSVDLAWYLLAEKQFSDLRAAIYSTPAEHNRFRQLVVNCVMATDIVDKELKLLRDKRWSRAFSESPGYEDKKGATDRKATIVIEHLIQASDVSHTMQHWMVYRKWNELLFMEGYQAFVDGRADFDPSLTWYEGELGFFDFYVVPLAKKLKECGVFGVSSDEYLAYALKNRAEWAAKGKLVVDEMKIKALETVKKSS